MFLGSFGGMKFGKKDNRKEEYLILEFFLLLFTKYLLLFRTGKKEYLLVGLTFKYPFQIRNKSARKSEIFIIISLCRNFFIIL